MRKRNGIRLAFVLSDTHCGSTLGLMPPDHKTVDGNIIRQNAAQEWLWKCWILATEKWLPEIAADDRYVLIVNGDAVEGLHHGVREVISANLDDHVSAAEIALKPLTKRASKTFISLGTECHTRGNENNIAKAIGATPDPNTKRGAWDKIYLTMAGVPCCFQHHISTTSRWHLRAGRLSIAMVNEQATAFNHGHTPPKVLGAAHCHIFDKYDNGKSLAFTTGAWQWGTRHVGKVATAGVQRPEPTIVALDWRDRNDGDLPAFHYQVYTAPDPKREVI
jgi:hypothetical protein